jgi:hypothetical protein
MKRRGFADADLGMDRDRALADAGLNTELPLPDPAAEYGPLSGIYLSVYEYYSSSRDETLTSKHHVLVLQRGGQLVVRSLPASSSQMAMSLTVNGQAVTGIWTEQTSLEGWYRGAVYHGGIQMLLEPPGRMTGKWVGYGKDREVNSGVWTLTLVDADFSDDAVGRWNRVPE